MHCFAHIALIQLNYCPGIRDFFTYTVPKLRIGQGGIVTEEMDTAGTNTTELTIYICVCVCVILVRIQEWFLEES